MDEKIISRAAERQLFLASDTLEKQTAPLDGRDGARSDDASAPASAGTKKRWASWKIAIIVALSVLAGLKLHSAAFGHSAALGRWHSRLSGCKGGDRRALAGYMRFLYGHGQHAAGALAEDVLLEGSKKQERLEELFLSIPNNASALEASRSYTGFAHTAGTPGDLKTAVLVKQQWEHLLGRRITGEKDKIYEAGSKQSRRSMTTVSAKDGGPEIWIDTYHVLLNYPTPKETSKTAIALHDADGALIHQAKLAEDALSHDPTSPHGNADVPPFHGYSKAGTAIGQLVYAHSGTVEDFERLRGAGVDVKGKIALVRYGGNFRGLKVKAASEAGAAGVIIYSDPAEDNGITVENGYLPYPAGPARQPSSLQRGSVQYLSLFPGDPTTPGKPSYKDSRRVTPTSIPDIPSLPLSYEDALPLLRALNGKGPCFDDWKGGLGYEGVHYCSGPSEGNLTMTNDVVDDIRPIWNTYAKIPGHLEDEVVVLGNHRDAWVFGAADPNSGTASMHEIVKALGLMMKKGWKPLRTIIIASWDGEEYGLVGSTEMAEDFPEYAKKFVAYINVDVAASGSGYSVRASPSLADLFVDVSSIAAPPDTPTNASLKVGPLGSGSDFTGFLQHLGVASADLGYRPHAKDAIYHYHSIYDSEYWMERYGDPGFHRHVKLAKAMGLASLRLADYPVLPLNTTAYAFELPSYLKQVEETASAHNITSLDFSGLSAAIEAVQAAAIALDAEVASLHAAFAALGKIHCRNKKRHHWRVLMRKIRSINRRKMGFERGFISEEGLPKRSWYKHLAVAPGYNLGYGATTMPGITEAITIFRDEEMAKRELGRLSAQLKASAAALKGTR